jgi:hypothetical protein
MADLTSTPRWMRWTGMTLSVLPSLMLLASGAMKVARAPQIVEGLGKLGYPEHLVRPIGLLEIACTLLYLVPQTAVLGALLLTGYLSGAVATHVRVSDSPLMVVSLAVVLWAGLFLRDERLRALLPLRRRHAA